mgnify:FL=1
MSLVSDKKFDEGQTAFLAADYDKAIKLLESLGETAKSDPAYLKLMGLALHKNGTPKKAGPLLRKALIKSPKDLECWSALGEIMEELQQFRDAAESYSEALFIAPGRDSLLAARARCNQQQKKMKQALRDATKAAESNGDHLDFLASLALQAAQMGMNSQNKDLVQNAVLAFEKHSELVGGDLESLKNAAIFSRRNQAPEKARELLLAARNLDPESADVLNILANTLRDMDRFADAQTRFEQALKLDPDHVLANYNLGELLAERNQFDKAEQYYRKAIALMPDYLQAYVGLGRCLAKAERHQEAQEIYDQALTFKPGNIRLLLNKAYSFKSMGDSSIPGSKS